MTLSVDPVEPGRREPWRLVVRVAVSLMVIAVAGCGLLLALALAVLQCGDNCSDTYQGDWRYTAQLVLAAVAGVSTLAAAALGFTARVRAYRWAATAAGALSTAWLVWVFDGGF